jgi:hypothetical protein
LAVAIALAACLAAPVHATAKRHARSAAAVATAISLSGPPASVRYRSAVTLRATLTAAGQPLGSRPLSLYRDGSMVASAGTDAGGKATFRLKATRSATYEARFAPATPADVAAYLPGASNLLSLVVRPLLRVELSTALRSGHRAVGVPRERVRLSGKLFPSAAGKVTIVVRRGARELRRVTRTAVVRRGAGRFGLYFKPRARGSYVFRVQRAADQLGPAAVASVRLLVVRATAGLGSRGRGVRALQSRLSRLGYLTPVTGTFDDRTGRAVLAFRKVNGMSRTTDASKTVFRKLERGGGGFHLRYPRAGRHVEFDWSRQVLVLVGRTRIVRIVHASSGKPSTPTVFGTFHFYSKSPGFNAKGMYFSNYFIGGYAIHGYVDVPAYAASHGCIRIPIPSAIAVYHWIRLGDRISVYR